jgi:hypothetical protein
MMALGLHIPVRMKSIACTESVQAEPERLDDEAVRRVLGAGQAVYNGFNRVMPYLDSTWKDQSCVERASTIGMYGNIASGGMGIASGLATATGIGAPAAPLLGAGAIATGAATSIAGNQYLKQCNAIEGKK